MLEMILYTVGFFLVTLLIQYLFSKRKNKSNFTIWQGTSTIVAICILGIVFHNINYLAAILGYVMADGIGKEVGWHS